jgi:hypothetical protein
MAQRKPVVAYCEHCGTPRGKVERQRLAWRQRWHRSATRRRMILSWTRRQPRTK